MKIIEYETEMGVCVTPCPTYPNRRVGRISECQASCPCFRGSDCETQEVACAAPDKGLTAAEKLKKLSQETGVPASVLKKTLHARPVAGDLSSLPLEKWQKWQEWWADKGQQIFEESSTSKPLEAAVEHVARRAFFEGGLLPAKTCKNCKNGPVDDHLACGLCVGYSEWVAK
jgi:hypothetical protein